MSHSVVLCACQCTRLRRRPRSVVISLRRGKGSQSRGTRTCGGKRAGSIRLSGVESYLSLSSELLLRICGLDFEDFHCGDSSGGLVNEPELVFARRQVNLSGIAARIVCGHCSCVTPRTLRDLYGKFRMGEVGKAALKGYCPVRYQWL